MNKAKNGAVLGAFLVGFLTFIFVFSAIFSVFSAMFSNSISASFWVAFSRLGLVKSGGFFEPILMKMPLKVSSEFGMDIGLWSAILLSTAAGFFVFYYGVKTGHFGSGAGRKQLDGLVSLEKQASLAKILAGAAKKKEDFGVEISEKVPVWRELEPRHWAFIGGSGSGKTNAILPFLRSAASQSTVIVHDPKGDYTANLQDKKPIIIAPWLECGWAWDVGKDINTRALAAQFAADLVPVPEGGNQVFGLAARSVLTGVIVYFQAVKPGSWELMDIKEVFEGDAGGENLEKILTEFYPIALKSLGIDKTRASVLMNLVSALQNLFVLADAWEKAPQLSLIDYLEQATLGRVRPLILQNNAAHKDLASSLFRAVLDFMSGHVLGNMPDVSASAKRKIWFFIDETKALPKLDCVEDLLNQGRSKGARVVLGCQNPFQISDWSRSADSDVWGNICTIFVGQLGDPKSMRWAADLFGKGKFERFEKSYSGGQRAGKSVSVQRHEDEQYIIHENEFSSLETGSFFVRVKGSPYIPKFKFPLCQKESAVQLPKNEAFLPVISKAIIDAPVVSSPLQAVTNEENDDAIKKLNQLYFGGGDHDA